MSELKSVYKFKPIRGLEDDLMKVTHTEGALLIATDTGKMWMDTPNNRVALGGSGASLLYGKSANIEEKFDEFGAYYYLFPVEDLEDNSSKPQVNDLVLNSDGGFYRITAIDTDVLTCNRIAVSGNGGGGGGAVSGGGSAMTFRVDTLDTYDLINYQTKTISFTANSATDADKVPLDDVMIISWQLQTTEGTIYDKGTFSVKTGEKSSFEFGSKLRPSASSKLVLTASGSNQTNTVTRTIPTIGSITTSELTLAEPYGFSNSGTEKSSVTLKCDVSGNMEKIVDFYVDGDLKDSQIITETSKTVTSTVTNLTHGYHEVLINLYQSIGGDRGGSVDKPLQYEIAVVEDGKTDPIIWLGDYNSTYYNYDSIKIPYHVYNPDSTESTVKFVKGIAELGTRTEQNGNTAYSIWQITDATDIGIVQRYYIRAMKTAEVKEDEVKYVEREINFTVEKDPKRDLSLRSQNNLMLSFNAAGRSSDETKGSRQTWSYTGKTNASGEKTYNGTFTDFNWYNNGWHLDENNDTCLRISNGAKFSIPIGSMVFNDSSVMANQSKTFEFEFKVRNIRDYSSLIKEYTRYSDDKNYWEQFRAQSTYDNYDNFLKHLADTNADLDYDTMTATFSHVERVVSGDAAFCEYYDGKRGLRLGPQDGFFASNDNVLAFDYVEDKLVNLSIVFDATTSSASSSGGKDPLKRIYVYVQGVLTAVSQITESTSFELAANEIVFKSDYCDLDLYKFRIYDSALSVQEVLFNYAADRVDVLTFDHTNDLLINNSTSKEFELSYKAVKAWNEDSSHTDSLLMPYIIFDTGSKSERLPYAKSNKKLITMTFVNPTLDKNYQNGTLDDLAKKMTLSQQAAAEKEGLTLVQYYYKHHCPSFTSWKQMVNFAVQGTSSQFYPRRNYKAKTKGTDDVIYMYMNSGPFADLYEKGINGDAEALEKCHLDFFYFNNYSVGTTKFTLKVDFMESSGTYNMGMANLVHTAYKKHPIDDYNNAGAFTKVSYVQATESEVNPKMTYYKDAKGKTKMVFDEETQYEANKYYKPEYSEYTFAETADLRTNVQGFPVMAFWKYGNSLDDYRFIGRYNMLLDKGSDEAYGFKPDKAISAKFGKIKNGVQTTVRKLTECWEYSNNQSGFCSFKDPMNRHKLSFDTYNPDGSRQLNANQAPLVVDSYEYRYNTNGDLLDYIYDPAGETELKSELMADDPEKYTEENLSSSEWRATQIFDIYKNWEKANQWVWSTCIDNVPSQFKEDPETKELKPVQEDELAKQTRLIMDYVETSGKYDSSVTYYDKNEEEVKNPKVTSDGDLDGTYFIGKPVNNGEGITYGKGDQAVTYKYDTQEYRRAKFRNELSKHFDKDYCLVYFVMTEVLLAYDSRGKNCMMASWGPQEAGGDYIWYPIFYDMDTQLGINNTGIPSFDYYENATEDGTFSTSDSVLWNNLYREFFEDIKGMYKTLRESMNSSRYSGRGPLQTVDHIENWYLAKPFNDETVEAQREEAKLQHMEMCGDRPLAMFNMDEFFKYLTITNAAAEGYQDRIGNLVVDTNGSYFYALQGDRSLSRQQFLTRRINFIDSWFSLYNYSKTDGSTINGRVSANRSADTSDKWITTSSTDSFLANNEISAYYQTDDGGKIKYDTTNRPIKVNYLDADNYVKLTPYQNSYVTFYADDTSDGSVRYTGTPIYYNYPGILYESVFNKYVPENLVYIPGGNVMKDIGDISKLYWAEFYAKSANHLSRILLGNDHLLFNNSILKGLDLEGGYSTDPNTGETIAGKPLLEEVNLSGIQFTDKVTFPIDLSSSEKLEIFKALRSNLKSVTFSKGVALNTLYLPATLNSLTLIEANNLTNVLSNINVTNMNADDYYSKYDAVNDIWTAKPGLYIEGLTNTTINEDTVLSADTTNNLNYIEIAGGKLGYASYDLLYKLYRIYKKDNDSGQDVLKISMKDVVWSPYTALETDAIYNASNASKYFEDDGHYGFKPYTYTNRDKWLLDLANGDVYLYDETLAEDSTKIKNTTMLKNFISRGQFRNTASAGESTPVITGDIYINNDNYEEDEMTIRNTLLGSKGFEELGDNKLNIHFKKVKKQYKATFCQVEEDGTTTVLGTQVVGLNGQFSNPYTTYRDSAKRDNYDFFGWATANDQEHVIKQAEWSSNAATTASNADVHDYVFYAVFERHTFNMQFQKGSVALGFEKAVDDVGVKFGDFIPVPTAVPGLDESSLETTERYKFLGWTQDKNNTIVSTAARAKLVDVGAIQASADLTFFAVFMKESVYDSTLDEKYLSFNEAPYTNRFTSERTTGYEVKFVKKVEGIAGGYNPTDITGKITIPSYYKGKPVVGIAANGFESCSQITHIFFEKNNPLGDCQVKIFRTNAFNQCSGLVHIELPESLEELDDYALGSCNNLVLNELSGNIQYIESYALSSTLKSGTDDFYIGGNVRYISSRAINMINMGINTLYIGSKEHPTQLRNSGAYTYDYLNSSDVGFVRLNPGYGPKAITVFYSSAEDKTFVEDLINRGAINQSDNPTINYTPV